MNATVFWKTEGERISPVRLFIVLVNGGSILKHSSRLTRRKIDAEAFGRYALTLQLVGLLSCNSFILTRDGRGWISGA